MGIGAFLGHARHRDIQVSVVIAVAYFALHAHLLWNEWAADMSAYYYAGHFFASGEFDQIYAGPPQVIGSEMPTAWQEAVAAHGYAGRQTYPFLYLPWVAAIMAPVAAHLDPVVAMNAFLTVNLALVLGSCWLVWRIVAPKAVPLWLWSIISMILISTAVPATLAVSLGQLQILVTFLCLLAFERYKAKAFRVAGLVLAISAGLKLSPAAFAIIFLWDRNFRALAGFALGLGGIMLMSILIAGPDLHRDFLATLSRLNDLIVVTPITFSIDGLIYQVAQVLDGTAEPFSEYERFYTKPHWLGFFTKSALLAGLVAIWASTRDLASEQRLPRQLLALSLLIPLTAPLGWVHYFLLATLFVPALTEMLPARLAVVLTGLFLIIMNVNIFNLSVSAEDIRVFPNLVVCIPFLILLMLAVIFFRRGNAPKTRPGHKQLQPAE